MPRVLGADFGVPAVEAAENKIRIPIRQPPGLDRVQIVDEEQEDIAVRRVERRRIAGDVDVRIVDSRRPVEHARHLPARVAGAVAGDLLHGVDQFMVEDPAVIRAGHRPQLEATVLDFERLHLLGAVGGQTVLEVDRGERGRELAQIGGWRADQAGELAKLQCVGATGVVASGSISLRRSGSSRLASTRISSLSTMRVWLRSDRAFTEFRRSVSDRYRSSAGRLNHSDDTRPIRWPRLTSTL